MANNSVRGLNALGYVGVNAPNPANTVTLPRDPTANDYDQFNLLDTWLNTSSQVIYFLTSKASGVATWTAFSGGGLSTFHTDSGDATPSGGAITFAGDGVNISSSGSSHTVTYTLSLNPSVTTLTASGLIKGQSLQVTGLGATPGVVQTNSSGVFSSSKGNDGQILIGSTAGAPLWRNITAGTGVTITNAANSITINASATTALMFTTDDSNTATPALNNINIFGDTDVTTTSSGSTVTVHLTGPVPVAKGGTGVDGSATFSTDGVLYYDGTVVASTAAGTTGQVLTGSTGNPPVWASAPVGVTWNNITGPSSAMLSNNGYVANDAGSVVTLTLPATPAFGDVIEVVGTNGGLGWHIAQNAGQYIQFGADVTSAGVGGSLASTNNGDAIRMVCMFGGASASWAILSSIGNITIV